MSSTLLSIPTDVLILILSQLNGPDLLRVARVCKRLQSVSQSDSLWLPIINRLEKHWPADCVPLPLSDDDAKSQSSPKKRVRVLLYYHLCRLNRSMDSKGMLHVHLPANFKNLLRLENSRIAKTEIRIIVSGDPGVGKTCFCERIRSDDVAMELVPTYIDWNVVYVHFGTRQMLVNIVEPFVQMEDARRLRYLAYPGTDVFLISYSCTMRSSFEAVTQKWISEIQEHAHCPEAKFVLHCTKSDLRRDPATIAALDKRGETFVSKDEGKALAMKLGCYAYVETSALTGEGCANALAVTVASVIDENPPAKIDRKEGPSSSAKCCMQ